MDAVVDADRLGDGVGVEDGVGDGVGVATLTATWLGLLSVRAWYGRRSKVSALSLFLSLSFSGVWPVADLSVII